MTDTKVDIIIPVYNGASFITEAITSVLEQSHTALNLIVVDDGSVDSTAEIVRKFTRQLNNVQVVSQPHSGISIALNNGIRHSSADYIAFLDADDLWHRDKLKKQVEKIYETGYDFCFCMMEEFDDDLNKINGITAKARGGTIKGFAKSGCLCHRRVFDKYGLFDEAVVAGDFIEWFSRVLRNGEPYVMIDEVLCYRRVHGANTTGTLNKADYLKVLKSHLDAIRKTNGA